MKKTNSFLIFLGIVLLMVVVSACGPTLSIPQVTLPSSLSTIDLAIFAGAVPPSYDQNTDELTVEVQVENLADDTPYVLTIATQDTNPANALQVGIFTSSSSIPAGQIDVKTISVSLNTNTMIANVNLPITRYIIASVDALGDIDVTNNEIVLGTFTVDTNGGVTIP